MAFWPKAVRYAGFVLALSGAIWSLDLARAAETPGAGGGVVRTIVDPATGSEWVLLRDGAHPGGPGRLELSAGAPGGVRMSAPKPVCVVQSGDRIRVEEHTGAVDLSLEAVALNRALEGGRLRVRLAMGGAIVAARAGCQGRADLIGGAGR
jgi:hypothetical protein